ncbi:MAG: hypothetical protein JXR95_13235 [Deltaproteobacteria bacterium]|nr:hypothetical protein [Deltaproteobacteria bacterium]
MKHISLFFTGLLVLSISVSGCDPDTANQSNNTSNNLVNNSTNNITNNSTNNTTNNITNEICDDGYDNDQDGMADCDDLDCIGFQGCQSNNQNDAGDVTDTNPWEFDADAGDCPPEMIAECTDPIPSGCGSAEIADNGLDDNCNGEIDENTNSCTPGDVRPCFLGPPNRRNVGACVDGQQLCVRVGGEFGVWGDCEGGISPSPETCDGLDNDCNGCTDDGLCCSPPILCPTSDHESLQGAQPFNDFVLDGGDFYTGTAVRWEWTISNGPCDEVLGVRSFTVNGQTGLNYVADTQEVTFNFKLSGWYNITMRVYYNETEYYECVFVLKVWGPGLRVENCWDTSGDADVDLHLMKEGLGTSWCGAEDCRFSNCKGNNWSHSDWSESDSDISMCIDTTYGSDFNDDFGVCKNPRLDIDNISTIGIPENINVDYPTDGQTYRIGVHYYSDDYFNPSMVTHPVVNIYCDGQRIATYGYPTANEVEFTTASGTCSSADLWRVADVLTEVDSATGAVTCTVDSLTDGSGDPYITQNSSAY